MARDELTALGPEDLARHDAVVSYVAVRRLACRQKASFGLVVLDEAQAIRTPARGSPAP